MLKNSGIPQVLNFLKLINSITLIYLPINLQFGSIRKVQFIKNIFAVMATNLIFQIVLLVIFQSFRAIIFLDILKQIIS